MIKYTLLFLKTRVGYNVVQQFEDLAQTQFILILGFNGHYSLKLYNQMVQGLNEKLGH